MSLEELKKDCSKKQKKKLNRGQRKALKSVPTKKCHFKRNKYNTGLPKTEKAARKRGWKITFGNWAHQFNLKMYEECGVRILTPRSSHLLLIYKTK